MRPGRENSDFRGPGARDGGPAPVRREPSGWKPRPALEGQAEIMGHDFGEMT